LNKIYDNKRKKLIKILVGILIRRNENKYDGNIKNNKEFMQN
jgi:hypothetical protein